MTTVHNGLEGIVAAETRLSSVDGERGELIIGGYRVEDWAPRKTFEETVELLWEACRGGQAILPVPFLVADGDRQDCLSSKVLRQAARGRVDAMDALRMATATLVARDDEEGASRILSAFPVIVASYWRLSHDLEPIAPRADLRYAANYLYMLTGIEPHEEQVRGLETYLNTVVDHGLNASTFTARVIASTGSDLVSAITGAIGALKGPLHGGAPGPALDMVFEIRDASRAEEVLRRKIESGERLMGFGHRVYKVRDPRADVLAAAAERLFTRAGDMHLYELARHVERTALRLLEEYKPGRRLQTNVEFYTALLLHGLGLETPLFTPTFAISRAAGWIAHCIEQRRTGRIIRPQSVYVGGVARLPGIPVTR
ncbi:MAG TPA: citrate synthase/methylcitrate synthase [Thermoanaerobaculia bacterium]|nr:citrate synthase/methylcitrate synthase [Thermoanaerobaculia bacterium]